MIRHFLCKNGFRILSFIFIYSIFTNVNAQTRFQDDLSIALNYHYGFIVPEYSNLIYIVEDYVQSASLYFSKKTTGKNDWEQLYNYPEYGLSLFYSTLGNDQVHGREIALFPFFNLDIISGKRFNFYNETGIGLGYVTRKFDLQDNYLNVAVGSHLNIHFQLKFGVGYKIPKTKLQLHSGLSFDHFSNSNTIEPNLGLNYATAYTGLKYMVGDQSIRQPRELQPHGSGYHYEFIYSAGGKHASAINPKIYFTSSGTFEFMWEPFRTIHLGIGTDLFYDTSTEVEMLALKLNDYPELEAYKKLYDFRSGIHFSQVFIYNKLSLIIQEGFYILLTDKVNKKIMYNRGIIRYRVSDHFFVHLAMKSHLHILDYPEFGLGLRW